MVSRLSRGGGGVQLDDTIEKLSSEEVPGGKTQWEAGVGLEGGGGVEDRQFSISPGFWPKRQQSI